MTLIPNMRLLGLPSGDEGRDWQKLTHEIDAMIESEGFDLSEETVLIHFGRQGTLVFRPVIGGLRELSKPWVLVDRVAGQVETAKLEADTWDEAEAEINALRSKNGKEDFTLMLKRRMNKELHLSAEVLFSFF